MINPEIVIARDFSDTPGARTRADGPHSGEEFYEVLLSVYFKVAVENELKLLVDFDGAYGYATSFISESFGRLAEEFGTDFVLNKLQLKSEEDPTLIDLVTAIIREPIKWQD